MKKQIDSDVLPEYDFSGGVRGKYVSRLAKGSNIAVLDKDVQRIFPNSVAVNTALRALGKAVEAAPHAARNPCSTLCFVSSVPVSHQGRGGDCTVGI